MCPPKPKKKAPLPSLGSESDQDNEEDEKELDYDDLISDSDGIEMPDFVTPENLDQDDVEIEYYAKKLGINDEIDEWDDDLRDNGYSRILEGISTAKRSTKKKEQQVQMVKAVRTPEEESARKDFTGLLNRLAPSNFNVISGRIHEAFSTHPQPISVAMFTRCITQRIFSDAQLPPIFIEVYAKALKEVPDAIQPTIDAIQEGNESKEAKYLVNVKPFLAAVGEETVNFYSSGNKNDVKKIDSEVSQLATIARNLHMTTDVRRSVFFAIETAVDVLDAFGKIAKLALSKTQRKEVPFVILECCKNEGEYNAYYASLASNFIEQDKLFAKNLRVTLRNTIKLMAKFEVVQIRNIALFFNELIQNGSLDFNILKGINLIQQDAHGTLFVNILFRELLQKWDSDLFLIQIEKVSKMPNFGGDMKKFFEQRLKSFVEKNKNFPKDKFVVLKKSIDLLNVVQ